MNKGITKRNAELKRLLQIKGLFQYTGSVTKLTAAV